MILNLLNKKIGTRLIALFSTCFMFTSAAIADIAIVTNLASPLKSITKIQVKKLWLGEINSLNNTAKLEPIDLPASNSIHTEFYNKIVKKKASELKIHWRKKSFSGKIFPPKVKQNDAEAKKWVSSKTTGIAYINKTAIDKSIKVLLIIK